VFGVPSCTTQLSVQFNSLSEAIFERKCDRPAFACDVVHATLYAFAQLVHVCVCVQCACGCSSVCAVCDQTFGSESKRPRARHADPPTVNRGRWLTFVVPDDAQYCSTCMRLINAPCKQSIPQVPVAPKEKPEARLLANRASASAQTKAKGMTGSQTASGQCPMKTSASNLPLRAFRNSTARTQMGWVCSAAFLAVPLVHENGSRRPSVQWPRGRTFIGQGENAWPSRHGARPATF